MSEKNLSSCLSFPNLCQAALKDTNFILIRVMGRRKRKVDCAFGTFGFSVGFLLFLDVSQPSLQDKDLMLIRKMA
jgi:hypothetical protein